MGVGCCGDLECQRLLGGSQSKCIKKHLRRSRPTDPAMLPWCGLQASLRWRQNGVSVNSFRHISYRPLYLSRGCRTKDPVTKIGVLVQESTVCAKVALDVSYFRAYNMQ